MISKGALRAGDRLPCARTLLVTIFASIIGGMLLMGVTAVLVFF